nr:RNA-dependent RNA polymerase [Picobirnavirus sp.]
MILKKFPARLQRSIAESRSFQQALERLKTGKDSTPRSWVYEDKSPEWILNTWCEKLAGLGEDKDLRLISEWDLSKKSKFAAQGGVAPFSERQETLKEYWAHLSPSAVFNDLYWKLAIKRAVRILGFNRTGVPYSVDAVVKRGLYDDKYNTSSGDPLFIKRKRPEAIIQAKQACEDGTWDQFYPVLGSRASMGKTGAEARWIFMFPMSVNLMEQKFQQPLQDYLRNRRPHHHELDFFTPWDGYEEVQRVISREAPLIPVKFGCDYSKMDQHFNFYHALQCFEVIKHFFNPKYWNDLYKSIRYTFFCDVVAPDCLIAGPHAMPSGSGWTNFLETVFNFILVQYCILKYHIPIHVSMGIGDDQLWFIRSKDREEKDLVKLTDFIVSIFNSVNLEANAEKQEVSTIMASFLQRRSYAFWNPNSVKYAGIYPTVRALTSEIYPEFYHNEKEWTKNTFALRCLMILENCNRHPLFKEFCIFIANGNKNILEFAQLPDAEILLTRHQAKKIANFIPTYNQEKQKELVTHFESLKIIRDYAMKRSESSARVNP